MKSLGIITCDDTYHYWGESRMEQEKEGKVNKRKKRKAFEGWYCSGGDNKV